MNLIEINKMLFALQSRKFPEIKPADQVTVSEKIIENKKTRIQKFQGIVISNTGSLLNQSILLRKKHQNFWIEKRFFLHSPLVEEVVVDSHGHARRSVLSYLRQSKNLTQKLKRLKK